MQRGTRGIYIVLTAVALGSAGGHAPAQGPFGGGGMPPGMKAKIEKMRRRMATDPRMKLTKLVYQLHEIDREAATQLTPAQAARLTPIFHTWRAKTTMSDDQARQVLKQLALPLTEKQIKKMSGIKMPTVSGGTGGAGGWRGGGFGGGGGMGWGGGRGSAGRSDPLMALSKAYNPLNPDTLPFAQQRPLAKKSEDDLIATLERRLKP